uniref:Sel1 repeat family protein n=1 Tax=Strongyloides venezuelensis TaxID=75913 RepID=A0A0K0G0G9_STRVS
MKTFSIKNYKGLYIKYFIDGNPEICLIDYSWNYFITKYFLENLYLEKTMWNLSTFGGAYSSMGDYFDNFALVAGKLSIAQYNIAKKMGNQVMMSRCKLFFALSLAQRNQIKLAFYLIKEEYDKAKLDRNHFILDCAKGTLAKIKSLKLLKCKSKK